uniref:DNA mismatch repair protein Mlh3 n=1 Tax=Anthurium amnicola TaxID=1678845 RepID=A0A1D1ZIW5_9ARAE
MKRIKHLPGSVHTSLRSSVFLFDMTRVVEELILNSLDAGATKVHICVNVGACYVKVEDDGFGVTRDGLMVLGEKYATSKFQNLAEMDDDIESLGSRGEALSSLSDISLLEVITKTRGKPNAYHKVIKGRKCLLIGIDEHRQNVGTTVIVRDLFYNQPVRRRSMQSSPKKMLHSLKKCVVRAALLRPQVSFTVIDLESEHELLRTIPSSSLLPLVSNHFGSKVSGCLHKVSCSDKELDLSGYLSGLADSSSVKTLQYLYINSRFVCRGPIHKLINNLASNFHYMLNYHRSEPESQTGKRQRMLGCPAYVLNLCCPLSSYDLTFEPSKTIVEFKDWASVLSFIEQAVCHSWKQIPAHSLFGKTNVSQILCVSCSSAEPQKQMCGTCIGIRGGKGDVFTPDTSVISEMTKKEYGSWSQQNFMCQSASTLSEELPQESYDVFSCRSSRGRNEKNTEVKHYPSETNGGHQIEYFPKKKLFNSQDISDFTHDEMVSRKSKTNPCVPESSFSAGSHLLSDHIAKIDQKDDLLALEEDLFADREELRKYSRCDGSTCHLREDESQLSKAPFLFRCSRGLAVPGMKCVSVEKVPANSEMFSDNKELGFEFDERESFSPYDSYVAGAHYSCESFDSPANIPCQEKYDSFWSSFGVMRSCLDKTSNDLYTDFTKFCDGHGLHCPKDNDICSRRVDHLIESTFTSQLSYSEVSPGSSDCMSTSFLMTTDNVPCNVRSDGNCNLLAGLTSRQFETSKLVDSFDNYNLGNPRKSLSAINCKDDELCFSPGGIEYQKHYSHEIKFENVPCDDVNDHTAWSNFNSPIGDNTSNCNKYTCGTRWEEFQDCQLGHSANRSSRRSHSAPPLHRQKSKFYTIYDYSKTVGWYSDDARSACLLKNLSQPWGISWPFAKSVFNSSSCELMHRTSGDEKLGGNETNMVQTNGRSEKDAPEMEYTNGDMTKWRGGDLHPTLVQGSVRSHNVSACDDEVLDISSGLLHLAGSSLVPESISRDALEDAKVLLQVDRKFIPVTAGGILVAIDQHAADERIRLEELRYKVMSGEGCTIVYLDLEQELVLPEIGLQLVQNYGEQIKKWGWVCNTHFQCSGSFAKNLNLLKQQSCGVTLLAVPCILGINLTDKDLLEYLEQLADTDGTSTMPPAALRILNFKACRGAIMFGDALMPSECSLIVEELKGTSLCFQCAHGRPTTVPLVNMVELHKHLLKLELHAENRNKLWHGLGQHQPSVERAQVRLSSAKQFHNG